MNKVMFALLIIGVVGNVYAESMFEEYTASDALGTTVAAAVGGTIGAEAGESIAIRDTIKRSTSINNSLSALENKRVELQKSLHIAMDEHVKKYMMIETQSEQYKKAIRLHEKVNEPDLEMSIRKHRELSAELQSIRNKNPYIDALLKAGGFKSKAAKLLWDEKSEFTEEYARKLKMSGGTLKQMMEKHDKIQQVSSRWRKGERQAHYKRIGAMHKGSVKGALVGTPLGAAAAVAPYIYNKLTDQDTNTAQ